MANGNMRALPGARRIVLVLALIAAFGMLAQFTYLIPDSAGYLSWGHSLLWDQDVDFTNEYRYFGMIDLDSGIQFGSTTATGRPGNPFGMGTALLWMPFLLLGLVVSQVFVWLGQGAGVDGFTTGTLFAAHLGSWTCALVSIFLVDATVREWRPDRSRYPLAWLAAFFAMPWPYYVWQLPSYSHAASVCMVAATVYLTVRWRHQPTLRHALLLGLVVGVAGLVRVQNLAFLWFPVCLFYAEWRRRRQLLVSVFVLLLAALLAFLPQLFAWRALYGSWLQIPQGQGFVAFTLSAMRNVLLSTRHGLLPTAPIVLLGGVLLLRHVAPRSRSMALAVAGCFLLQWMANAAPVDWWAGWSFGARRFCNIIPLLAVTLALWQGRVARVTLLGLIALNGVQWLRVAGRQISGEGDPGWNGLWGGEFLEFLPKLLEVFWTQIQTSWESISVLAQPGANTLQVRPDPLSLLLVLFVLWGVVVYLLVAAAERWLSPGKQEPGNSHGSQRV